MVMIEKISLLSALGWRNLWRNPRRTGLVLIAVAVGVWSILSFTSLLQAWSASSLDATLKNLIGQGQIHAQGYLDNPGAAHPMTPPPPTLQKLLDDPSVAHWAPRIKVPAAVQSAYETIPVNLVGIDPQRERGLSFIANSIQQGHFFSNLHSEGILLGQSLAKRLHIRLGQRVVLMSQGADGNLAEQGFQVIGLFSAAPQIEKTNVFVALKPAQKMLALGSQITGITFNLKDITQLQAFIARLKHVNAKADIQTWAQLRPMAKAMNQLSNGFIQVWIVIMFVLMTFGIVNTLHMALHERVRELALFQALGLRPSLIFVQVILETALEIFLGVSAGALLATATIYAFHDGLNLGFLARGAEWLGAGHILYPQLNLNQAITTGVMIWALGLIACLSPIWRIIRRVPIEAINRSST